MIVLVEELSKIIPASTYLTELAVQDQDVRISGLSSDAPALIGILEGADLLTDVRFAAPTIRDEEAAQDRFEIVARLASPAPNPTATQ
jgi:Tfp pilus assembly protein PilN